MLLNDHWTMLDGERRYDCRVPCSALDTLIREGALPDPYYRDQERIGTEACERDYVFEKTFTPGTEELESDETLLTFRGIDTLGRVTLNGRLLGETDNMHRVWEYSVRDFLKPGQNTLRVELRSALREARERQAERPLQGSTETFPGYPHLRKAHYMFGWDWGPILPDAGIWRDVSLRGYRGGRILNLNVRQRHEQGKVILTCQIETKEIRPGGTLRFTVLSPDGERRTVPVEQGKAVLTIDQPRLWWVRGLGEQPLYTCRAELWDGDRLADEKETRVGLRTLTVSREKDAQGQEFCFMCNGIRVFAMGGNYIPEDQLLPGITPERTRRLLEDCRRANFNFIRVWGGGFYPDDDFYDWCDENGLMVWQDFMFACSAYLLRPDFEKTVRQEIRDNVIRIRNHPSLALWCGNNEIESAWMYWNWPEDPEAKRDYLRLFEGIIPEQLRELDPDTFYWPSSPSTGGGFRDPCGNEGGDMHYWAVWHNFKPIEAFRETLYRFCSEYGFESLPDMKTIRAFADESLGDLELSGRVMEAHQKCSRGTEKIRYYLAQMVNEPESFSRLVYCSQLVQAECIRSNVEHMRRHRGICMGSSYWQINDSNPVISWSGIDCFGRWKALHYAARRFYAPVLLSCDDTDPGYFALTVTNDTREVFRGQILCRLRDRRARVLLEERAEISAPAFGSICGLRLDLRNETQTPEKQKSLYLEYELLEEGVPVSRGTTLFVRPKDFDFLPGEVSVKVRKEEKQFRLTLVSDVFVKSVCLSLQNADTVFSDNWFDLHGAEPVTVTLPREGELAVLSPEELESRLQIEHYGPSVQRG